MNWTERRRRFRAILAGDKCVHPGSVYDPISARIAEDLGFELGMFAGSTASLTVLGAPDLIVLTLSEFAAQCYRINRAGNLPLMVDADHGYGNAMMVMGAGVKGGKYYGRWPGLDLSKQVDGDLAVEQRREIERRVGGRRTTARQPARTPLRERGLVRLSRLVLTLEPEQGDA